MHHDLTAQLLVWLPAVWAYVWPTWLAPWAHLLPAWGLYRFATYRLRGRR